MSQASAVSEKPPYTEAVDFKPLSLIAGLIAGLVVFFLLPESLAANARIVAGIAMLMATWWITEAIPIPATSLLPLVLFPFFGIASVGATASPYAHSIVFLVLGGVMLGLAAQRWDLHRRFALLTILAVGTRPAQIVFGLMFASWFITMWVSNTATAVIMVPIGGSIIALVKSLDNGDDTPKFSAAVLLGIAYAITIGSMATLIGQPPMALMNAYMEDAHGLSIGFGHWMLMGVPFSTAMLILAWFVLNKIVFRAEVDDIPGGRVMIERELQGMGRLSVEEKRVLMVFASAVFFWVFVPLLAKIDAVHAVFPWLSRINDTSIAILAAILMFVIPASKGQGTLLEWSSTRNVPWGVLILFGGGLTLSAQFTATGLSAWIGESVSSLAGLPPILVLAVTALVIILLTELTSNTATAAAFFPIMGAIAEGLGIDPFLMTIVVTFAVSCAFMLPVATPSNAVAFATGDLPIRNMIRAGIWLNVIGLLVIMMALYTIVPLVFDVSF
ncbi:DASS family sodium-coupled anion symporter [Modicisalibacter tunisiensis]|uniref:DASS family sodium-coupled anion symporter n=1 Tax=Modicisalibacter tunisiensis TaxID=390637 RepID=A0ABS7WUU5_9GAMM|nr:DASS family sodium-coupled anion symporter [Modicisalibacter tunisiensis]MBZ9566371.1 DASS family sodium-coupled anion symporter [Modicisalibacter tunisiensis]